MTGSTWNIVVPMLQRERYKRTLFILGNVARSYDVCNMRLNSTRFLVQFITVNHQRTWTWSNTIILWILFPYARYTVRASSRILHPVSQLECKHLAEYDPHSTENTTSMDQVFVLICLCACVSQTKREKREKSFWIGIIWEDFSRQYHLVWYQINGYEDIHKLDRRQRWHIK